MELTTELGTKIINETKILINEHIIILNNQAIIIASTDQSRIGDFHEGAEKTIKNNSVLVITTENEKTMQGVKAGINLPIAINDNVIGVIGVTGNPEKVIPFGSLMQKMTELLIQESIFIQESEWKARALEKFIFDWLQLDTITTAFTQRAEVLGVNLHSQRRCSLISIHKGNEVAMSSVISQFEKWLKQTIDGIIIKWGNDQLLILSQEKHSKSMEQIKVIIKSIQNYASGNLQVDISVGIGKKVAPSLIKNSYFQADKALKVAINKGTIIFYEDLLLDICLNDVQSHTKEEFIQRLLGPIQQDPVLLNTLKYFLDNDLHLKATAEELHIHINTLHYRLKRIHEITKLNPKSVESVASFFMAFLFLEETTI